MIPIFSTRTTAGKSPLVIGGLFIAVASFLFEGYVSATPNPLGLRRRDALAPALENTVVVTDADNYWLVFSLSVEYEHEVTSLFCYENAA